MFSTSMNSVYVSLSLFNQGVYGCPFHVFSKSLFQLGSPLILVMAPELTASFTPTSKVSWKVEAFSLCMFLLFPTLREVPHGMKGTGPKFVTRPVYSRSQLQEQQEHSFCSSSTYAFISCSLYTVHRYCTSLGTPDLRAGLG